MAVEQWTHAAFNDFKAGDRIQFWTNDNGYGGVGAITRTGTVVKVTPKTLVIDCESNLLGKRAVIRLADWSRRCPMRTAETPNATDALHTAEKERTEIVCNSDLYSDKGRRVTFKPRCTGDPLPWIPVHDQFRTDAHRYSASDCIPVEPKEITMALAIGRRVRTLIDLESADRAPEQPDIPAGSHGTITDITYAYNGSDTAVSYGVLLDASVDRLAADMYPSEIEPA